MAGHLYWQSARFSITAFVDRQPRQVRVIASGDFGGSGSAVLRGALGRLAALSAPIRFDAADITALCPAAAAVLAECAAGSPGLTVDAVPDYLAAVFPPELLTPAPALRVAPLQRSA